MISKRSILLYMIHIRPVVEKECCHVIIRQLHSSIFQNNVDYFFYFHHLLQCISIIFLCASLFLLFSRSFRIAELVKWCYTHIYIEQEFIFTWFFERFTFSMWTISKTNSLHVYVGIYILIFIILNNLSDFRRSISNS